MGISYIYEFAGRCIAEWNQRSGNEKSVAEERTYGGDSLDSDFLGSLLSKHRRNPDNFTVDDAYYHVIAPVLAGGETTGVTQNATMYFLRKHPQALEKLREEVEELKARSTNKTIAEKEAQGCSYLQAVIKGTLRLFPAIGLNLLRVVLKGGLTLAGRFFPRRYHRWYQQLGCTRQSLRLWSRRRRF